MGMVSLLEFVIMYSKMFVIMYSKIAIWMIIPPIASGYSSHIIVTVHFVLFLHEASTTLPWFPVSSQSQSLRINLLGMTTLQG